MQAMKVRLLENCSLKIVDESGKYAGHNAVDFMYATGTATRSNPKVAFVFKHQMSKVSLNITDSNAPATKSGNSCLLYIARSDY